MLFDVDIISTFPITYCRFLASSIMANVGHPIKLRIFITKMDRVTLVGMALAKNGLYKFTNCCKTG